MNFPTQFPVTSHTKHVGPGSTFVAIKGMQQDGIDYIKEAIAKGATHIVIANDAHILHDCIAFMQQKSITLQRVPDTRLALAHLSALAAGNLAQKLKIIGITGTKGKTTSSFLLEHILKSAGHKTALLSTVYNRIGDTQLPTHLTTQQPDYLHQFFKVCVQEGVEYVVMEVAAQAFTLHRVHGLQFDGALFTNFSQEHAEFYATEHDYFAAKKEIIQHLKPGAPLMINNDDARCAQLPGIAFSLQHPSALYYAHAITTGSQGIEFQARFDKRQETMVCPALMGAFNVYNLLGVLGLALELGVDCSAIQKAFASFEKVPGRLERYPLPDGRCCIIDYAHNPSSFESILSTLRTLTSHLIVVFGCGGDRDATKRPVMGSIASKYADLVVLTTDNPRSEDPQKIIDQICAGIPHAQQKKCVTVLDRKEAIEYAYNNSKPGSLIALLGKGPDEYQIIGNEKTYFSEAEIIKQLHT
jgi:UDP-N-acetylmuramoyl-L-alanyl-D-glutamate--2,6-diaminopimelate ligase